MKLLFLCEDLSQSINILANKYDMDLEQVQSISQSVPEHALEWTIKQISDKSIRWPEDANRLNQAFTWYTENKKNAKFQSLTREAGKNHRNILNFTLHEIEGFQDKLSGTDVSKRQQVRDIKQDGAQVVYDKHGYKLIEIWSPRAMAYYAKGTRWCVSDEDTAEYYLGSGLLYLILKGNKKIALYHEESDQLMGVDDQEYELTDDKEAKIFLGMGINPLYASIQTRMPALEGLIIKDPIKAYNYAYTAVKGRWPEAEPIIATDPAAAYSYAKFVIKGRWPEGEPAIATDGGWAYNYARDIIRGAWPEGEDAIFKSYPHKEWYQAMLYDMNS